MIGEKGEIETSPCAWDAPQNKKNPRGLSMLFHEKLSTVASERYRARASGFSSKAIYNRHLVIVGSLSSLLEARAKVLMT